jgi:predicted dinucleotide-binding enzyme
MKIAVLGTGIVGRTIAGKLAQLGHEVAIGTRDVERTRTGDHEAFAAWSAAHPTVVLASFADAAAPAEIIVNATSGAASLPALTAAGTANLAGKVIVDISNPLDFSAGFPPTLSVKDTDSLGEQIQRAFPDARVVKALNTLTAALMVDPGALGAESHTVFVSGDDPAAKQTVVALLHEFGHTDVVDLGDITTARGSEMYLPLWLRLMGALGTPMFNLKIVR